MGPATAPAARATRGQPLVAPRWGAARGPALAPSGQRRDCAPFTERDAIFDLSAYLARIGLDAPPASDAAGLARLQRAHRLAIPFENLDVALGRAIALDSAAVAAKLVTGRRGGYCFEHNRLFLDALAALGFVARPLLARVWLGIEGVVPPRTHTLALVTLDDADWIADCGFGGSYSPAMPLVDGAEARAPDGARFRLARDSVHGWMLVRDGDPATTDGRAAGSGWQRQYSFTLDPVSPSDTMLSNRWVQSAPESRFVQRRIVSIPLPNGFAALDGRRCRRRDGGRSVDVEIGDPNAYRHHLELLFGLRLTSEEVARLGLFGDGPPG